MLKLTYSRERDPYETVTVLGDGAGIRDLYHQLTHNYRAQDGSVVSNLRITDLDGNEVPIDLIVQRDVGLSKLY